MVSGEILQYGREHFNLDRLIDYQLEPVDETTRIVNHTWRRLDGQVRRSAALQHRVKARLHDLELQGALHAAKTEHYMSRESVLEEWESVRQTLQSM